MLEINDEKLISQYLKGDEKSLEILIKRYLGPVYDFVFRLTGNPLDAEDIVQDVFLKTWKNIRKPAPYRIYSGAGFNPKKGDFKSWIFQIAKNASVDFLRKKKAVPFSRFENEQGYNSVIEKFVSPTASLEDIFDNKNALAVAAEELTPKYRTVFEYRRSDITFRKIAGLLGESINTVKSRYRRAILIIRKSLNKS